LLLLLLLLLPPEPEELLVEEAAGGSSVLLLTETGIIAGARVLFNGAVEKEEDTGRKNGTAVLFDFIARCCWFGEVPFTPVTLML
jgi:hypothetical protein